MPPERVVPAQAPHEVRAALTELFQAGLAALDPTRLVARALRRHGSTLVIDAPGRPSVRLPLRRGLVVVGAGKGSAALAAAVEDVLGPAIVAGVVVVPPGYERPLVHVSLALGSHPIPDRRSIEATRRLLAVLDRHSGASVLVLITGGASSLLVAPAPGITLADKRRIGALLLASGAPIEEMNAVRKHLSALKGGWLANRLTARPAAALVVSDVPDDDLAVVGSGPTVPDSTTFGDALAILRRRALLGVVPRAVRRRLERGAAGRCRETPKDRADVGGMPTLLLAGNATARAAVARRARRAGYPLVRVVARPVTGPVAAAALDIAHRLARPHTRLRGALPAVLVLGGETTVTLGLRAGLGGRNQEMALEVARALAGRPGWALLAAGTDGVDGPTDAAGAFADGGTVGRAASAGCDVTPALAHHDVYPLLRRIGALFRPGPTGTNVADLAIALVWRGRGWRLPARMIQGRLSP